MATLAESPLHKVMISCYLTKQSGMLVVENKKKKKVLVIDKGIPVACRSNIKQETLGHIVVEKGLIKQADLDVLLEACKENDGFPLGSALVANDILRTDELAKILQEQLMDRIYDLFTWTEGSIKLKPPKKNLFNDSVPLSLKVPALILNGLTEAVEKSTEFSRFKLRGTPEMVDKSDLDLQEFSLSASRMKFLRSIDGEKPVEKLLSETKTDSEDIKKLVFVLSQLGLLRLTEAEPQAVAAQAADKTTKQVRISQPVKAASGATKSVASDAAHLASRVQARLSEIDDQNYFEILGVDEAASDDEIRQIYFQLAKDFHPDRLRTLENSEDQKGGEVLFGKISEAFNTLMDPTKRAEYMDALKLGVDDASEQAAKILESEVLFQKGRGLVNQGEFQGAKKILEEAVELYEEEPEYFLYLGWAIFRCGYAAKNQQDMQRGKEMLEKNKDSRSRIEAGYLFLGRVAKIEGDEALAERQFEKAVEINSNCHEAIRELRLLDMRREKGQKGKGLFGRKKK